MGIRKTPDFDGNRINGDVAEKKEEYDDLLEKQVENWFSTLHTSIGNRRKEQDGIIEKSGGKEAHQEKLNTDPVYKEAWDKHEIRIEKEKKAYNLARDWLEEHQNK